MKVFKLVEDDLVLTNGLFEFVDRREAVAQMIDTALKTFLGEWFLDPDYGTPWYEEVLGVTGVGPAEIAGTVGRRILQVPKVTRLAEPVTVVGDSRRRSAAVAWRALSSEGEVSGGLLL